MSAGPVPAYIGLGSNLDDPPAQLRRALAELDVLPHSRLVAHSRLYHSAPLGPPGQPDYVNAVAVLATELPPRALLTALQQLEDRHGRIRGAHWGPRTLDLDILLYGEQRIDLPGLRVPHPELAKRAFVLFPLQEVAPDLQVPGLGTVRELAARLPPDAARPLDAAAP